MPLKHQARLLAWRPANAGDEAWLRAEAGKQGRGALGRMLDEALAAYRKQQESGAAGASAAHETSQSLSLCLGEGL